MYLVSLWLFLSRVELLDSVTKINMSKIGKYQTSMSNFVQTIRTITSDREELIPAIAQQHDSNDVLMVAWMNHNTILETIISGRVCYWSRSRNCLWHKGEQSGQVQFLNELLVDCDSDTLLLLVEQLGVACHTGRYSCFYQSLRGTKLGITLKVRTNLSSCYS